MFFIQLFIQFERNLKLLIFYSKVSHYCLIFGQNLYIGQRLRGHKNWVCPGGVPPAVQLYAQRTAWEGYQGDIHLPLLYGGKFWVAQPRHPGFFGLRNVWRRCKGNNNLILHMFIVWVTFNDRCNLQNMAWLGFTFHDLMILLC